MCRHYASLYDLLPCIDFQWQRALSRFVQILLSYMNTELISYYITYNIYTDMTIYFLPTKYNKTFFRQHYCALFYLSKNIASNVIYSSASHNTQTFNVIKVI